ncbi:hypothetical protein ACFWUP_06880 [Nocardia sp. NPDC058658]|uniref:hypothetical protein n=1 Tax=Nocardia sp. NPDC058658 TaxID=3346580 RepID=UPI00365C6D3D
MNRIRVSVGIAALGTAAAAVLAPPASATVTGIAIASGNTLGTHSQGTGCSYTVTVTVDDNTKPVFFFEEGQGPSGFAEAMPKDGVAVATWTPSSTTPTYIYAFQPNATSQMRQPVDIGTGINLGSACVAT